MRIVKKTLLGSPFLIAGVFLVIALYFQFKSLFGFTPKAVDRFDEMKEGKDTISPYTGKALADKLYSAMANMGTDEKTIYSVLGLLSKNDFSVVYNQFGKRRYDRFFGNDGLPFVNDELDLIEWIYQEMNDKEIQKIKEINPALAGYFIA